MKVKVATKINRMKYRARHYWQGGAEVHGYADGSQTIVANAGLKRQLQIWARGRRKTVLKWVVHVAGTLITAMLTAITIFYVKKHLH